MSGESARERQVRELDDLLIIAADDLEKAYKLGWERLNATERTLEQLHQRMIAKTVHVHFPDAQAIAIEATDQGGPGWVFDSAVVLDDGTRIDGSSHTRYGDAIDDLNDDDDLSVLLSDLGRFHSSEDHPAHDFEL